MDRPGEGDVANQAVHRTPTLAWAAVACGIAGWLLMPVLHLGPDALAIVLGVIVLRRSDRTQVTARRLAWAGVVLGAAKLVFYLGALLWVVVAFSLNPVAH